MYTSGLRKILVEMADNIKMLVDEEAENIKYHCKWPIVSILYIENDSYCCCVRCATLITLIVRLEECLGQNSLN